MVEQNIYMGESNGQNQYRESHPKVFNADTFLDWLTSGELPDFVLKNELVKIPGVYRLFDEIPESVKKIHPDEVYIGATWNAGESSVITVKRHGDFQIITSDGIRNPSRETLVISHKASKDALSRIVGEIEVLTESGFFTEQLRIAVPESWDISDINEMVKTFCLSLTRLGVGLGLYFSVGNKSYQYLRLLSNPDWVEGFTEKLSQQKGEK